MTKMTDTVTTEPDLPAQPAWIRPWVARHTRAVSYSLDGLRAAAAEMSPACRDLQRRFPKDSVLACSCGARSCRRFVLVLGHADTLTVPVLLVSAGPKGDPFGRRPDNLTVLHRGGGLTPEQVDVLALAPLGSALI